MTNPIEELLVRDLVENYRPVDPSGRDWYALALHFHRTEREHMSELETSILAHGQREPVVLSAYPAPATQFVLDGTHRVALALLSGQLTIATRRKSPEDDLIKPYLLASVKLQGEALDQLEESKLVRVVRSWKLDEQHWLNAHAVAGGESSWEIFLNTDDSQLAPAINQRLRSLLRHEFPGKDFLITTELHKE